MIYPRNTEEILGFKAIRKLLSSFATSENVKDFFASSEFSPVSDPEEELFRVEEFLYILQNDISFPSTSFNPIKALLGKSSIGEYFLEINEILEIRQICESANLIIDTLHKHKDSFEKLLKIIADTTTEKNLIKDIDAVIDDDGEIKNTASAELHRIRKELIKTRSQLDREFSKSIKKYKKENLLTDNDESIRNGRRVLAVLAEKKRTIKGLLHDESDTGKTAFIEPEETILLNNRIVEIQSEERREIIKILKKITRTVHENSEFLANAEDLHVTFDTIRAKAKLAYKLEAIRPKLTKDKKILLRNAFHPILLIQNTSSGKETVPYDIEMDAHSRCMVISGPNAGGKSVCLKTLGIYQLMLRHGLLIPADSGTEIYIFENLFIDIGDAQSVEDELSTYSSKLKNAAYFVENCNENTLVLIDEFGSGTDPSLGGAMAESVLFTIHKKKAFSVITTHYANLKIMADKLKGMVNASMLFDEVNLKPTYKLEQGKPGNSYTFFIAENSGLPEKVISQAKKMADKGSLNFEKLLLEMKKEKEVLRKQNEELLVEDKRLKKMIRQFEKMNTDLDYQKKQLQYDMKMGKKEELLTLESRIKEILKDISASPQPKQKATSEIEAIRKEIANLNKSTDDIHEKLVKKTEKKEILEGSRVKMIDGSQEGIVKGISGKRATVVFGIVKMKVNIDEIEIVESTKKHAEQQYSKYSAAADFEAKLDIRGMRRDEAIQKLETFIDSSLINNSEFIKIIHGKGSGALRKAVWETLKTYKQVKEIKFEEDKYGGEGATIAVL
ncbi:MAG: hypothetical protein HKN92_03850 [Chitinophagales bacterium]|nr:hypothetical protein [Chitinophagales bacterium]